MDSPHRHREEALKTMTKQCTLPVIARPETQAMAEAISHPRLLRRRSGCRLAMTGAMQLFRPCLDASSQGRSRS